MFTDSEHKDMSVEDTYRKEPVEPTQAHFLPKSRPNLSNNGVVSTENVGDEMSISGTEDHRLQMENHLGRCVERHQALLE